MKKKPTPRHPSPRRRIGSELEEMRKKFAAFCKKNGVAPPRKWTRPGVWKERKKV